MTRDAEKYQGIVIVPKNPFRGDYEGVHYCPEARDEFMGDVERGETESKKRIQDSRWLPDPVSLEEITAIEAEMLKKIWGTR